MNQGTTAPPDMADEARWTPESPEPDADIAGVRYKAAHGAWPAPTMDMVYFPDVADTAAAMSAMSAHHAETYGNRQAIYKMWTRPSDEARWEPVWAGTIGLVV